MRLGETPVPIPNTMVKTQEADGTMLETAWESRWLPDHKKRSSPVIRIQKVFCVLMTDEDQSDMYLENCIQTQLLKLRYLI